MRPFPLYPILLGIVGYLLLIIPASAQEKTTPPPKTAEQQKELGERYREFVAKVEVVYAAIDLKIKRLVAEARGEIKTPPNGGVVMITPDNDFSSTFHIAKINVLENATAKPQEAYLIQSDFKLFWCIVPDPKSPTVFNVPLAEHPNQPVKRSISYQKRRPATEQEVQTLLMRLIPDNGRYIVTLGPLFLIGAVGEMPTKPIIGT